MKTIPLIILLALFVSCNSTTPTASTKSSGTSKTTGGSSGGGGSTPVLNTLTTPKVRVKNYNQYNMTLEKLTGLNRANYNALFESIKGSLPADNEIEGLTSFNLIAMTRLADAYCTDFVNREATVGLNGDLSPMMVGDVRNFLFSRFLDAEPGDTSFDSLREEVDNVLNNNDGSNGVLFVGAGNTLAGGKNLATAACVTILASPYITLLE